MQKISLVKDVINRDDINALIEWLQQEPIPRLTKAELTVELEKEWAKIVGTKYSVFVNSGSSAIFLLLAALRETGKYSNKIIVPALSWVTDVSSPMLLGFEPLLCDCNLEDLSCDLNHLEKLFIENKSDKPMLFLSVAPLGLVPKMNELVELCNKYNVVLLEDICESMGSKYQSKMLGSFGLASMYSLYFGHILSTIEGGFINTNDDELYYLLLAMRNHGWARDLPFEERERLKKEWKVSEFDALYAFYYPGINLRSTDLQAFIGLRAIKRLDEYSNARNKNFYQYKKLIKCNELNIADREGDFIANFAYPMISKNRNAMVKVLQENNIEVRPLIAGSMGNKPFWVKKYGRTILLNADKIDEFGFYLPNHQELTFEEIEFVANIINQFSE